MTRLTHFHKRKNCTHLEKIFCPTINPLMFNFLHSTLLNIFSTYLIFIYFYIKNKIFFKYSYIFILFISNKEFINYILFNSNS